MHESGLVSRIINAVLQAAAGQNASQVLEVDLLIGKLNFLHPDQLRQVYQSLTRGTMLEGSKLIVEEGDAAVRCNRCGEERVLLLPAWGCEQPIPTFNCPACGGEVEILRGRECLIKGIRVT